MDVVMVLKYCNVIEGAAMARILIVDDDPDLRLLTRRMVSTLGAEAVEAHNGLVGESLAIEHRPELILLDIMMPGQDGLETCTKLRQQNYTGHIVLMSAMPETEGRIRASECGASAYIQKPMTRGMLKNYMEQLHILEATS
jgi:DNA-binding response OmpR family regulator